jgi:hypothetical protein
MRIPALCITGFAVAMIVVTAAVAGASTIAAAPEMPLGKLTSDGSTTQTNSFGDFWRLPLSAGDKVIMDYATQNGRTVTLHVYLPAVTDYTFNDARPVVEDQTGANGKHEWVWVAPTSGRWTLRFEAYSELSYQFTTHVQHVTQVKLAAPSLVRAGKKFVVHGSVVGVKAGSVEMRLLSGRKRVAHAVVPISSSGFTWKTSTKGAGSYKVVAIFYGDADHRSSSASKQVRAA